MFQIHFQKNGTMSPTFFTVDVTKTYRCSILGTNIDATLLDSGTAASTGVREVTIDEDKDGILVFLMNIIGFFTGLMAVIHQVLRLRSEEKEDEEIEQLASEIDEVEARLAEHDVQLDALRRKEI